MLDNATTKIMKRLIEPFPYEDIEWRVQQSGISRKNEPWAMVLAYVTNRAIMNRLDEVFGCYGWKNEYKEAPEGGVLCGISVWVDGEEGDTRPYSGWVTKWDGASNTDIESVKGGLSNAMKRAAVQWGIGRYLYNLETNFVNVHEDVYSGKYRIKIKERQYSWNPPSLPVWALPKGSKAKAVVSTPKKKKAPPAVNKTVKSGDGDANQIKYPKYSNADLIIAIEKLGKEMTPPNWKHFKESRLKKFGALHFTSLTNEQLLEYGTDLKQWIKDGKEFKEAKGL